jgi:hypothetical protein
MTEGLYVPVVNRNYMAKGSPDMLEGFVPDTPVDDKTLNGIRSALYAQGLEDGGSDKPVQPEVTPNSELADDETPVVEPATSGVAKKDVKLTQELSSKSKN